MKYIRQSMLIASVTMAGELLRVLLPFPVPAGGYGLCLLLLGLCTGMIKLSQVEETASFLLDIMPVLFVPAAVELMENLDLLGQIAVPLLVVSLVSTILVMAVTGKVTEHLTKREGGKNHE